MISHFGSGDKRLEEDLGLLSFPLVNSIEMESSILDSKPILKSESNQKIDKSTPETSLAVLDDKPDAKINQVYMVGRKFSKTFLQVQICELSLLVICQAVGHAYVLSI